MITGTVIDNQVFNVLEAHSPEPQAGPGDTIICTCGAVAVNADQFRKHVAKHLTRTIDPALLTPEEERAREDVLSWDDAFLQIASVIAGRSKDPATQVGACIVSKDQRVLSLGYNGTPRGFDDQNFPWGKRNSNPLETKYPYVVHAERNAILNFRGNNREFEGGTIYVTHYPCRECAKEIVQSGLRKVVFLNPAGKHFDEASEIIFLKTGVSIRQFDGVLPQDV